MADPAAPTVQVDNATNVNVPAQGTVLPYHKIIGGVTFVLLFAFALISGFVLCLSPDKTGIDAATKGAIIQTWNNLALMAATFWVGSSLGGKMATASPPRSTEQ